MNNEKTTWLQKPIHSSLPAITNEVILFAGIIILALITRFYDLETRVMSHDESLHTYFSWLLYKGQGYQHTPMMHGPYQFHIIALSYFLFGVSDFTARIPAVLFSIATVWMVWYWRRYLGTWGTIVAAFLMVISPYMLYYGRYVRNESFVGFSGILLLYAILRYIESGEKKYLYFVTLATLLHFTAKETAFIYTAQALIFLFFYFILRITREPWQEKTGHYRAFILLLAGVVLLASVGAVMGTISHGEDIITSTETAAPANPTGTATTQDASANISPSIILFGLAGLGLVIALIVLIVGRGWDNLLKERSFDLLILFGTFVLPQLTAFVLDALKKLNISNVTIPTDSASVSQLDTTSMTLMGIVLVVLFIITIVIGMLWNRDWWKYGALYWGIFTILYTTVFTNAPGFFTGLIGSLGYWLVQQDVERGSQPIYYYWLIQIPMYEFLPVIGALTGSILGAVKLFGRKQVEVESEAVVESKSNDQIFSIFFGLMIWWSISSIVAFSIAGERMPWLTYHMTWPMILFSGWAIGQIIESVSARLAETNLQRSALSIFVFAILAFSAFSAIRVWNSSVPPFQGTDLAQLQATTAFILPVAVMIGAFAILYYLLRFDAASLGGIVLMTLAMVALPASVINGIAVFAGGANPAIDPAIMQSYTLDFIGTITVLVISIAAGIYLNGRLVNKSPLAGMFALTVFGLLAVQTMRTSFRASYINYDNATEYLVYAHGATGVKDVLAQVEEISKRTSGGLNAIIAYDASAPDTGVSWPVVWYLRDFTALRSFDQPSRSLREAVAVIVDQKNFDKIEGALGDDFYRFDYIRMWWPNQDYFNLDQARVANAVTNPAIRDGIFDIWFNRDYTKYAQATNSSSLTLTTWSPADQMRLYVRKDVASQIWNYGVGPSAAPVASDPYKPGAIILSADQIFGSERYTPLGLNAPRAIAPGLNADLYIADSRNHRILHIASDGSLLHQWGTYGAIDYFSGSVLPEEALKQAPLGTLNEPWGVAVGPDGSVYVTDTWNHRVQKFTGEGKPIKAWGQYGQPVLELPETASSFWGPRGIAVGADGRVYVADTGNKRIVVFDKDGKYLTEFGSAGFDPGQFDEPVAVAISPSGIVFVTDTWNQRVQGFVQNETGDFYIPTIQWNVTGWNGQSVENKPFIAVSASEHVFITDPEGYRVIEFTSDGQFVRTWGDFGSNAEEIGLASGIALDQLGHVWVTDSGNNRILRYTLP